MIDNILINVAYDDINKLNLSEYNIEPNWNKNNKTDICKIFGNELGSFKINSTKYYINNDLKFIYPIILFDEKLFENYKTIKLNNTLLNAIRNKKCKIVFLYLFEAYLNNENIQWINNLCKKYNFNTDDLILITSNLIEFNNINFTLIQYNYFANHINFLPISKLDKVILEIYKENYKNFINIKNKLHFLCFNGEPRLNRILMFNSLTTNKKLIGKSITSLRGYRKNYYYDIPNWHNRKISAGASLNIEAHLECFVNIITETLFNNTSIFLSEKTYKPIYMCQPFIIFGNPHSLKKLKKYGFKTFDKWWDESYDEIEDINERHKKIINILEIISEWDIDKCFEIKKEMKDILIHNYKKLFENEEIYNIFSLLKCENKPKKSII